MADDLPQVSMEEKELQEELTRIQKFPKLREWTRLFLDKTNKLTYGNRTQSAIAAYNLDPEKQYLTAGKIGSENYKKVKGLASAYYDREGLTTEKILNLLAAKASSSNNSKFLEMLMGITDIYEAKPSVAVQNNTQINIDATSEQQVDWNAKFLSFLKAQ